jgi:hypothetical protein
MRKSLLRVLTASLVLTSLTFAPTAWAASPYDSPPSDLKAYEAELLKKLITVRWGLSYGVGFAGNYNISQESKDKGINSLVVTTASTLNPENDVFKGCFIRGSDRIVRLSTADKNFEGSCSTWNNDGTDFAVVSTTVTLPTIDLWDSYWPKVDGWISVAYYVDGFGIVLRPSKIRIINEKLYVFGIEKVSPAMKFGGLAFNSDGSFVGTVSPYGPGTIPSDYLKLNGAPLQCAWENSNSTITNCSTRTNQSQSARPGVWTIDSPSAGTVSPTPSPKTSSAPISNELLDANNAVVDALSAVSESIDTCNSLVEEIKEVLGDFEVATPLLDSCSDLDSKFNEIDSKRALAFGGGGTLSTKISTLNSLTDQALAQADLADKAAAVLQDSQTFFVSVTKDLLKFAIDFATTAEDIANLNNRISGLPKVTQVMIQKNSNYKKLQSVFPPDYEIEELLNENLPDLSSISSISQLRNAPSLIAKARDSKPVIFKSTSLIKSVEKLIPKFVCVKGKMVSVTPATGKCAAGATKTSTA